MREDMFKIIVERPRLGSRHASKTKLRYDKIPERSRVTGRRLAIETGGRKWLNENLAPLKRYLQKQVGRKWDDVFSDICQHLDTGSTVKMHVREHLEDFVSIKVRRDLNDNFWVARNYGDTQLLEKTWAELYVDPDNGRIRRTRDFCRKRGIVFRERNRFWGSQTPSDSSGYIRHLDGLRWHMKLKGIWYLVELSAQPETSFGYALGSASIYEDVAKDTWRYHVKWQVIRKVQLSKKSLKAFELENGETEKEGKL